MPLPLGALASKRLKRFKIARASQLSFRQQSGVVFVKRIIKATLWRCLNLLPERVSQRLLRGYFSIRPRDSRKVFGSLYSSNAWGSGESFSGKAPRLSTPNRSGLQSQTWFGITQSTVFSMPPAATTTGFNTSRESRDFAISGRTFRN